MAARRDADVVMSAKIPDSGGTFFSLQAKGCRLNHDACMELDAF